MYKVRGQRGQRCEGARESTEESWDQAGVDSRWRILNNYYSRVIYLLYDASPDRVILASFTDPRINK